MTNQRPGGAQRPRRPGGRRFFPRRKVCQFCVDKVVIDYKDVQRMRRFVSDWGKIESRRKTGTCAPHQRQLSLAIKRARYLALLPYSGSHSLMETIRFNPRDDRGRRPFRPDGPPPRGPAGPPAGAPRPGEGNAPPAPTATATADAPADAAPAPTATADAPADAAPAAEAESAAEATVEPTAEATPEPEAEVAADAPDATAESDEQTKA